MGNAPPSRGAAASLFRGELGAVVAIVSMLRRWARSSWRGVFAFARSWRSLCLRTCGRYDRGTGSRHEGAFVVVEGMADSEGRLTVFEGQFAVAEGRLAAAEAWFAAAKGRLAAAEGWSEAGVPQIGR